MTPEEWLAGFEAQIADVKQKAAEFKANLEASGATETSPDGTLTVTVAPNGALTGLTIDDSAWRGSGEQLAGKIMQLARKAQRTAAVHVAEAFAPLAGEDSESLRMVTGYLPPEEDEPEPDDGSRGYAFTNNEPDAETRPRSGEPPARPRRPVSSPDDDEDFGNDQIFGRRDDW
ncbi:MAG TPA: YbaB/EbfC family nucleoid-associated protein [Actinophytocola sp.]|uniref:YbaB/EbfC family nucleoid-associated protein n=1 Tax=Actinophytocola sp. TaxID=1872138 RepID=UPI002DDD1DD2|nr:YbaB/EbfC family nucleoid-associated protein [Actinophytocola sp.]HEV2777932.1 YbaB/EbfC family nucleoid-associated protein [Actinophytocola sp.]